MQRMIFHATQDGVPFGTLTWLGAWSWEGQGGARCPVINNRVMDRARRGPYLVRLGLTITASHAEELARTWGTRATDTIEIVPIDGRHVPLNGAGHLTPGTKIDIAGGVATVDGAQVGRLPRSLPVDDEFVGVIVAATNGMAVIRRP